MRKNNQLRFLFGAITLGLGNASFAQTVPTTLDAVAQPVQVVPVVSKAPITTLTGNTIAPIGGAVKSGSERTLMDLGALDREVEFSKRLEALAKSRAASSIVAAPAITPMPAPMAMPAVGEPNAPMPANVGKPSAPPAKKSSLSPAADGIRLKAIYGVDSNLNAAFQVPGMNLVTIKKYQSVGGWRLEGFDSAGVTLVKGKTRALLPLDEPAALSIVQPGVSSGNANNSVFNTPLPNPNLRAANAVPFTR